MEVNILSPDKVDTELVESYKTDDLARNLTVLACSMHGSLLSISPEGYIVYMDIDNFSIPLVYAPVSEARRLFKVLCNDNEYCSIDDVERVFFFKVYCPEVTRKDLMQWSLSIKTDCDTYYDTGFEKPEFIGKFLDTTSVIVDEELDFNDDYFAQLLASWNEPYIMCRQDIVDGGSGSEDTLYSSD